MQAEYRSGTNVVRKGMIRSFMSMFKKKEQEDSIG